MLGSVRPSPGSSEMRGGERYLSCYAKVRGGFPSAAWAYGSGAPKNLV